MSRNYYNRYTRFVINEVTRPLPFLTIDPKSTDKTVVYNSDRDRLDKFSQQYYNSPYYGWLILLCNPRYGGVEENIPNGEIIRIPFPLTDTIQQYIQAVKKYEDLYGI